jgi:hypothetical protein
LRPEFWGNARLQGVFEMKKDHSSVWTGIVGGFVLILLCGCILWAGMHKNFLVGIAPLFLLVVVLVLIGWIIIKLDDIKKRREAVYYEDEFFGTFELNWSRFETEISWCGDSVTLILDTDKEAEREACVGFARKLFENQIEWDKRTHEYAANDLTVLANEWSVNEDHEISEKEFASRISLGSIFVKSDGSFTFLLDDDNMFREHGIAVYGDIENGPDSSDIFG